MSTPFTKQQVYTFGYEDGLQQRDGVEPEDRWNVPEEMIEIYCDGFQHSREHRDPRPPT